MRTEDAIEHFGSKASLARELNISRQAIQFWGDLVPADLAIVLEMQTLGKLKVNPNLYAKRRRERKKGASR